MTRERRARFVAAAYNAGTTGSDLVNEFIDWWMGDPGAELPLRPDRGLGDASDHTPRG